MKQKLEEVVYDNITTASELFDKNVDKIPMLWEPYLPKVGLACLAGPSDSGKSTLIKQLSVSLTRNDKSFLDTRINVTHSTVLYVVTEDTVDSVALITRKQTPEKAKWMDNLHYLFLENMNNILESLSLALENKSYDMVVMDVWMDTFIGNPNNLQDVRADLAKYSALSLKHNCLFLMIHHITKSGASSDPNKNALNGSQAIEARMRAVLDLRGRGKEFFLTITKGNYCSASEKEKSLILEFDEVHRSFKSTKTYCSVSEVTSRVKFDDPELIEMVGQLRKDELSYEKIHFKLFELLDESIVPKSSTTIKKIVERYFPELK